MRSKLQFNFNEGLLEYGTVRTKRNEATKEIEGQEFKVSGHLFFDYRTIRQEDYALYQTKAQTLDLKVQTYFIPAVTDSHKVRIDNEIYNVRRLDPSNGKQTMFWYLSKVGRFEV